MGNKARRLQKIAERNANISTENDQPGGPEFAEEVTYEFDNSSVFIGLTDDSYEPLDIDSGSGPPGYIEILDADINSTIDNQIEADDLEADISVNSVQPSAVLNTVENINASSITNIDNQIQTFDSSVFETKLSVDTELSVVESLADATDSANTNVSNNIELIDEHPLDTKINLSLMANVQNRESINLNRTDTNSNGKLDVITSNSSNVQPLTSKELFESASELNSEDFTMDNIPIQPQYNENTKEAIIFTNDTNRANPKNDGSKIVESSELQIFSSVIISEQQLVNDKILNLTEDNLNIKNKERTSGKSEPLTNAVLNQVDNNYFLKDNITKNDSETISSQFASDLAELERLKPPEDLFDDEEDGQYSREFIVKEQEVVSDKDIQDGETILQEYGPSLFPLEILQVKELNNNNLTKINENDSADNILSEQNITESTNNSDISTTTLIQNDTTNTSFFEKERTGDSSNVSEIAKDAAFDNNGINEVNPLNAVAILVNNNDGELNISNSSSIIFNDSNHEINSSTNHINSIINSNKEIESNVSTLDDSSDGAQTNTFNDIRKSDPYKSNINLENKSLEGVVDNFPNNMNESSDFIETINDSDEKEFLPWADPININTAHNNFNQIEYNSVPENKS